MGPLDQMTTEQLRESMHRNELQIERNNAEIARMAADARTDIVADLVGDDEFVTAVRAQAWRRHSPDEPIGTRLSNTPDGWPPSVEDPRAYLLGEIRKRVDPAIEAEFGASSSPTAKADPTPSVEKLRSVVGRINGDD